MNKTNFKLLVATTLMGLATHSFADIRMSIGHANSTSTRVPTTNNGWSLAYDFLSTKNLVQGLGLEYQIYDENQKADSSNMINFDYKLGKSFGDKTIAYGIISYGFQDIGNEIYNGNVHNLYAKGFGYGAGVQYMVFDKIGFKSEFKRYNLKYDLQNTNYQYYINTLTGSLVYRF